MEPTTEFVIPEAARTRYVERRKQDIQILRDGIAAGTLEEFKRVGHQLKGNAASFGYIELQAVGEQMEAAGEKQDFQSAAQQLSILELWLQSKMTSPQL